MTRWKRARIAEGGTHHVVDEEPLYAARFAEVLAFHEPGLAPVRDATGAYHIDEAGRPAYTARYLRTFGFYEGLAAVHARDGWHHVWPDGSAAYEARYAWCGNYQGGRCAVRDHESRYLHVDERGAAAGPERWRYAGDYREGVAVVQRDDGLHTHVDRADRPLHGRWFLDLDVFHKGFARARDDAGWMHVDRAGRPIYARRFAMVEPFYNGQARVERHDGALEVIDEQGDTRVELRGVRRDGLAGNGVVHDRGGGAMRWFIPPSVLRWLSEIPADRPVALLMRHSVRPPLTLSASDHTLPITAQGAALARELGAQLGPRLAAFHASPLARCVQTAEELRAGAGVACDITLDRLLGDPGVYVTDAGVAGVTWSERGHDAVMAYLAGGEGGPFPGLADPTEAARRLVGHMLAPAGRAGLHVFVTHDSVVTTTVARTLGRSLGKADWPLYLEGAFFWRHGRSLCVAYREHHEVCA